MKVLGLDLGIGSVGWALIELNEQNIPIEIKGMGSRIISLSPDESSNFSRGSGETKCSQRTAQRTARKGLDRYQMRRKALRLELSKAGMLDKEDELLKLSPLQVWQLRANAATSGMRISLEEIGRVLLHMNQKRGYRHAKSDDGDAKQKSYVAEISNRYAKLKELGMTPGQYFADRLKDSEQTTLAGNLVYSYKIKGEVLPRAAYQEEFDRIMEVQSEFYPDILTPTFIKKLKDIIFYQRPLKSCKRLVSICEFESHRFHDKNGNEVLTGPKVAPRTSPLAQVVRIYEAINNITLENPANRRSKKNIGQPSLFDFDNQPKDYRLMQHEYKLNAEERERIFEFLSTNEKLRESDLLKLLGLKRADGFKWKGAPKNGLEGNKTYTVLKEALKSLPNYEELLRFNIEYEESGIVDEDTGEIIKTPRMIQHPENKKSLVPQYSEEPLYKLWHTVYSSSTKEELTKAISRKFGITDPEVIDKLYKIDFVKSGYANKSAKFMRRLLPYLKDGWVYSEACTMAGVNHSDSITTAENEVRPLKARLENLQSGSLRQPIVEKILNQMINTVNAIKDQYGDIDEIRVELARELKQSKDERASMTADIAKKEKANAIIAQKIAEHGLRASSRNIQKYKMWEESGNICIYCGRPLNAKEFLGGHGGEIEHIIPRSIFFDDSFSNKACSCRECNREKGNRTAYDFMKSKPEVEFDQYLSRITRLLEEKRISKTKYKRLTTAKEDIPADFLDRDLRLSQYISRKSREILLETCRNVYASSGSVTDFFRHQWGYDMIIHNLNIPRYQKADLVEMIEYEHKGQNHQELRIKNWSKRLDHRHHAVDALVIALTRQGYVQRLSNLNAQRPAMLDDLGIDPFKNTEKFHLLEKWAVERPHFDVRTVSEKVAAIAVSLKSNKKLTTPAKRYIHKGRNSRLVQTGLNVPRGSLHEETIYGKVSMHDPGRDIKYAIANIDLVKDENLRNLLRERLDKFSGNCKQAISDIKKNPIYLDSSKGKIKIDKFDCIQNGYAVRTDVASLTVPKIDRIVDKAVREAVKSRFEESGDIKKFQQSLAEKPLLLNGNPSMPIKRVRVMSNDEMTPVRKDKDGRSIGYAIPGSNHHVAFYESAEGNQFSTVVTFWTAVKRRNIGLPPVIKDVEKAWDLLASLPEDDTVREMAGSMPPVGSKYVSDMKMGDMYVVGLSDEQFNDAIRDYDMKTLSNHLYRVQNLSLDYYVFRLHTWTSVDAKNANQDMSMKALYRIQSDSAWKSANPIKVRVDQLGNIKQFK